MWRVGATMAALMVVARVEPPLRCRHQHCRYISPDWQARYVYEVNGNNITMNFDSTSFEVDCHGASVLESDALPRAESARLLTTVNLANCPLPATSSIADTLATINVTLEYHGQEKWPKLRELFITDLPATPPLAAKHLTGLEGLTTLSIYNYGEGGTKPEIGFLASLRNLTQLMLRNIVLPEGELDSPPPVLERIRLKRMSVSRLPEALRDLPSLREVAIESDCPLDGVAVPLWVHRLELDSPATELRLNATRAVKELTMWGWTEQRPEPLTSCDALESLTLRAPAMVALPAGWLAKCSRLTELSIYRAHNLTALPPQLLLNMSSLHFFQFRSGALETLPADLLDHSPNLCTLELSDNRLRTLPSDLFVVARGVTYLALSYNDLDMESLTVLAPLHDLTTLILSGNSRLNSICDSNSRSPIINLTNLLDVWMVIGGQLQNCRPITIDDDLNPVDDEDDDCDIK